MAYLLDTHTFIWFINGEEDLSKSARVIISDINNKCYLSIASIWEIAVKSSLGKLDLKSGFDAIQTFLSANDIELLPIEFGHLQTLLQLENHHRDPFDRLIIAQATSEQLTAITKDAHFSNYSISVVW